MKAFALLLCLALTVALGPVSAQVIPSPGPGDPRLQFVQYDSSQVVRLYVASGYALMVQLAPGERIETMAVGDSASWQVSANKQGDALFVKKIGAGSTSNLNVLSDIRTYSFELKSTSDASPAPFLVRFEYAEAVSATPPRAEVIPAPYRLSGAQAVRPSMIATIGGDLILEWPETVSLPAVFRIDDDGNETLVNSHYEGNHLVIPGMPTKLVFRLDRLVATATRASATK